MVMEYKEMWNLSTEVLLELIYNGKIMILSFKEDINKTEIINNGIENDIDFKIITDETLKNDKQRKAEKTRLLELNKEYCNNLELLQKMKHDLSIREIEVSIMKKIFYSRLKINME